MSASKVKALVAGLSVAIGGFATSVSAAITVTPTEIELFGISIDPRTFTVENDDGSVTHIVDTQTTAQEVLTFDKFDPLLGTLIGVKITLKSDLSTLTIVEASLGVNAKVTFSADSDVTALLTGTGFITDASLTPADTGAVCGINTSESIDVSTCVGDTSTASQFSGGLVPGLLENFVGPGTFDLTASLTAVLTPSSAPDNGSSFFDNSSMTGFLKSTLGGSVSLVYTYDTEPPPPPVSEPFTVYLLGAGLGALAIARRRRR